MRKLLSMVGTMIIVASAFSQSYNSDLNDLGQYVQRMYMNEPFEGARIVENVDNCYLISVVAEKPGNNDYSTTRKAEVKGLNYANKYLNGAQVSQNTVVHTTENSKGYSFEEIEDFIESRSMGYVQTMQVLPMPEKPKGKKNRRRK